MSKFKLKFKLKQHTPLIHFQHDQTGATLRATELKPKLDRFLKQKGLNLLFGENGELNYKTKIIAPNNIEIKDITPPKIDRNTGKVRISHGKIIRQTYPNFFANMGDDESNYKKTSYTESLIFVEFFTFENSIKNAIEKNFAEFMLKTNFGTRQSKGFGSFYLDKTDKNYIKPSLKYKFFVNSQDFKKLFSDIEIFYKTLRSGINLKNRNGDTIFYFKSLMFLYAKKNGIQWDKKSIKETYLPSQLASQQRDYNNADILSYSSDKKYLMKDLLGLSSSESWKSYRATVDKENETIDRFKSPITFKPIKNKEGFDVYFFPEKIENGFLDQTFHIKFNNRNNLSLKTPQTFDVDDFIQFALKINLSTHVDGEFHNTKEYKVIESIYFDINRNLRGVK